MVAAVTGAVIGAVRLFDSGPLRFLPVAIREPRRAWLALIVSVMLTLSGSILLSWLATNSAPALAQPEFPMRGLYALVLLVIVAPVGETLIMAAVLSLLARFLPSTAAVAISAAGWGVAHSLQAPAWGLVIWWPFLIFSTLYLVWRSRGPAIALAVAATAHGLHNLLPALKVAYG